MVAEAFMPDTQRDLFGQNLEKRGLFLPQVIFQIQIINPGTDKIAGEENTPGPFNDIDSGIEGREGFRTDVRKAILLIAGPDQFLDQPRDFLPIFPFCPDQFFTLVLFA